ncbi:uncharacterized protein PAC_15848 [Phialocephala subalpina]|uniref:Uncharacterized protein n=1 Tax=Phialocephala subalpina TaxID=576137 RepID=A0A1L7XLQ7_9HELO|nr:uncharacterized protein PAC_15848 [Phialocephala subalpina]
MAFSKISSKPAPTYTIQGTNHKSSNYTHWKCYHCGWYNWKSKLTCKCGRKDNEGLVVKLKLFVEENGAKKAVKDLNILRDEDIINAAKVDFEPSSITKIDRSVIKITALILIPKPTIRNTIEASAKEVPKDLNWKPPECGLFNWKQKYKYDYQSQEGKICNHKMDCCPVFKMKLSSNGSRIRSERFSRDGNIIYPAKEI